MVRAELRFLGSAEHTCPGLPAVFALNSEQPTVDVGRVVSGGGLVLDSPHQTLMISRLHARLSFAPPHVDKEGRSVPGHWRVGDMGSTNGLLFNGCRVMEAKLSDGDVITFGGAKTTKCGFTPLEKATRSIYCYRFVDLDGRAANALDGHSESRGMGCDAGEGSFGQCGRKRSRLEEQETARQAKCQREQEERAEERTKWEEQERERQQQAERARQEQEEVLHREKKLLAEEAAAFEEKTRLEQAAAAKAAEALAKAQLHFEEQKKQWAEQQRMERENKEREERERVEREARELKEEEERARQARAEAEAKAKPATTVDLSGSDDDKQQEGGQKFWQEMNHGWVKQLFDVPKGSDEYKEVSDILAQDTVAICAKRNPWGFAAFLTCYELLKLERIQNPTLYACYMALKTSKIKAHQDPKEIYAVHGSAKETIDNICSGGFNRSYNGKNATLYGKGAYFAKAGNYAYAAQPLYAKPQSDGTQRLILTWVLEGERTIGDQSTIEPPLMSARGDGRRYDSTGDPQNSIVVTYKDQQAYPAYLVTFKARPGVSPMQAYVPPTSIVQHLQAVQARIQATMMQAQRVLGPAATVAGSGGSNGARGGVGVGVGVGVGLPKVATCSVAGCSREAWNGQPGQQCCRTCHISNGGNHGPDCDRKAAAGGGGSGGGGSAGLGYRPPPYRASSDDEEKSEGEDEDEDEDDDKEGESDEDDDRSRFPWGDEDDEEEEEDESF